jgi:hypothetical protein
MNVGLIEPLQRIVEFVDDAELVEKCLGLSEEAQKSVSQTLQHMIKGDLRTLISISKTMESRGEKVTFALQQEGGETECRVID